MNKEIKTKEDLQNDAVGFVYGVFTFIKYAFWFAVFCVGCFFYMMLTVRP